MKSNVELIKPWQGGFIGFFLMFITFMLMGEFMNRDMVYIFIMAIVCSPIIGVSVAIGMYRTRNWTVNISFTNKEDLMQKLNLLLFQMNFKLESNKDNFFIYKMNVFSSRFRIAVTLKEKEAIISGPKIHVDKLQKSLLR